MIYGSNLLRSMVQAGEIKNTYEGAINPASINLRLGDSFKRIVEYQPMLKLGMEVEYEDVPLADNEYVILWPGEFMLATTMEWISVPIGLAAFVQGRSSIGRIGLTVQNAGFVDPGFHGHITLELVNEGPRPIILYVGYPVVQLVYMEASDVGEPYNGKYNGQVDATGSKMQEDIYKPGNQVEIDDVIVATPVDPEVPEIEADLDDLYKDEEA